MSYVTSVLQPDEQLRYKTTIHWKNFIPGICLLLLAVGALWPASGDFERANPWVWIAALLVLCALVLLGRAWFKRVTMEIAVTDRRIIYKRGFFSLKIVEIERNRVGSVDFTQTALGRILDYGDIHIHSVGAGEEPLVITNVASPVAFSNHVTGEKGAEGA
jgi:uncharacterized membrane protein YdbT with pleckstrin-like domain